MVVELISVGTEILLGNIVNTNASYLAKKCAELGLSSFYQIAVGDNEERLTSTLKNALTRSDIIILTGGLGPTKDDLTKEVVANTLGLSLCLDEHIREKIQDYFNRSNYKVIPNSNWKQAMVIEGAMVIDNNNGTAPGLMISTKENKKIILLPGPPNEMIPMFEQDIFPYLSKLESSVIISDMVKICGIGESMVETLVTDLIEKQSNPTIAPYAKDAEVHLRVTAKADTISKANDLLKPIVDDLKKRFKENIYTTEEAETLEEAVVKLLKKQKLTVTTAESCTGGLVAGRLINVPGASDVFNEGFITYSNDAKIKYLNVKKETLQEFGAVSTNTAKEMAEGVVRATNSDTAIAITGLAGPDGGTDEKPVGLVYIACFVKNKTTVKEYHFKGNRQKIREYTVVNALDLLRRCILENYN